MPRANSAEVRKSIRYMRDDFKGDGCFAEVAWIGGQSIDPNYTIWALNIYNVKKTVHSLFTINSRIFPEMPKNVDLDL